MKEIASSIRRDVNGWEGKQHVMRSRSIRRSDNPHGPEHCRMRAFDRDLIRGGHYGQRSCEPHQKAEHMAAPTTAARVKKTLANPEPSTHGPRLPTYAVQHIVSYLGYCGRASRTATIPFLTRLRRRERCSKLAAVSRTAVVRRQP